MKSNKKYLDEFVTEYHETRPAPPLEKFWNEDTRLPSVKKSPVRNITGVKLTVLGTVVVALIGYSIFPVRQTTQTISIGLSEHSTFRENHVEVRSAAAEAKTLPAGIETAVRIAPDAPKTDPLLQKDTVYEGGNASLVVSFIPEKISGIRMIDQSRDEITKLGITMRSDSEYVFVNEEISQTADHQICKAYIVQEVNRKKDADTEHKVALYKSLSQTGIKTSLAVVPKLITDSEGKKRYWLSTNEEDIRNGFSPYPPPDILEMYQLGASVEWTEAKKQRMQEWQVFAQKFEDSTLAEMKLVPVRSGNFIFWFKPKEDLLGLLPQKYSEEIRKELGETIDIDARNSIRRETGCYLDGCRESAGAILNTGILPNPAVNRISRLKYSLSEKRAVIITLHDISGRKIKEIYPAQIQARGEYEEQINLNGVETGIYLVSVQTDKGEHAVQRLLVE